MNKNLLNRFVLALLATGCGSGIAFAQDATITEITPQPGAYLNSQSPTYITIFFQPEEASIEKASVTYTPINSTETQTESLDISVDEYRPGHPYQIGLYSEEIFYKIATEKAALGSTITVTLTNVTCNGAPVSSSIYDADSEDIFFENGNIIINYYIPSQRFALTSQEWPSLFYSNWAGVTTGTTATLTFNEEVASVGSISYRSDDQEYGVEGGNENVEFGVLPTEIATIDGNVVTIDFASTEVKFRLNTNVISIYVTGIKSVTEQSLQSVPTGHMTYVKNTNTGVASIESQSGNVKYYDLQGKEVKNPAKNQMLIKIQDGVASKTIIK